MISWQQVESDRLLCKHEASLHRRYIESNNVQFYNELFKDREKEGWTNYTKKNKGTDDNQNQNQNQIDIKRNEDLFRRQTYLFSNDYLCHILELVKSKKNVNYTGGFNPQ